MGKIYNTIKSIRNSRFFISVFKVGAGQLISQILALVSMPILSRIYSDVAYGDTALISSTSALLINLFTFGLISAIMKPQEDEESRKVFTTVILANLILSTGLTAVYAVLPSRIRLFEVSDSYGMALLLMWLYCVTNTAYSAMIVYMNRKQKYNKLFFNPIIGAVTNFLIAIPFGLLGFGFEGFMLTHILCDLLCCVHMMWGDFPFSRHYRLRDFLRVFKDYKEYVLFQYPADFLRSFGDEYPTQYLGRVFPTQELGGYSMCVRVLQLPIRLIAAPISTVYFRTATEYHQEGKNLAHFTYQMVSKILLISVLPVMVFVLISEPLFAFVLGEKWREAGVLAEILIIQYVLMFCSQTTSCCRVAIDRQRMNLVVVILRLLVTVVSCSAGYALFREVRATIFCYSVGQCIYNIWDMAVNFYCMDKRYLPRYLVLSLVYTFAMFLAIWAKIRFI